MKKTLIIVLTAFVVILLGAYVLYGRLAPELDSGNLATEQTSAPTAASSETTEQAVPDFTVYDAVGKAVKLSDFVGKPTIVNFWASWCGPCKSEMPDFQAAYEELGDQIQFIMVNMTDGSRETVDTASAFIEEQGYTFPVYFDSDYSAAYAYNVYSLPTTYFFNGEGDPVAYAAGAISAENLRQGIDMIWSGQEP